MAEDFRADEFVENWRQKRLANYRNMPEDVKEHQGIEQTVLAGGYGYRQVLELVQNGADALTEEAESREAGADQGAARIHVLFDGARLYVANTGAPLSREGIEALLTSHSSPKRGNQIGRFGIGFKSLLRLGGSIDILSRGVSLRFDPPRCRQDVRNACNLPVDAPAPSLRLAWALHRETEARQDPQLSAFDWAATVVRAEVADARMEEHIIQEIAAFPARFLLFLSCAVDLTLEAPGREPRRITRLPPEGDAVVLHDGQTPSRWRLVGRSVRITEAAALDDATHLHRRDEVPLTWAIPLDSGRDEAGRFWAFFPTQTPTRLPGILNAPWKVNSDRQSIIDGEWNRALMREAAAMIAEALPTLADADDPARALDYLPRQHDPKELAATLADELWARAATVAIVPDVTGALRVGGDLRRHASDDQDLVERWCALADETRQAGWVHPDCLRDRERRSRLGALADRLVEARAPRNPKQLILAPKKPDLAQAAAADWFAAIATARTDQAKAVIRFAADYANSVKRDEWSKNPSSNVWRPEYIRPTLKIVPDREGKLRCPDDIWLARPGQSAPHRHFVADELLDDPEIQRILLTTFEVRSLLEDNWLPILKQAADEHIGQERKYRSAYQDWSAFWQTLRSARPQDQKAFADEYKCKVRIRRRDGTWQYPYAVLLPGEIVASGDAEPENRKVLVDLDFHRGDEHLLQLLGAVSKPIGEHSVYRSSYDPSICQTDELFSGWISIASHTIWRHHHRVQAESFLPHSISVPTGSCLLARLKGQAGARLTELLLPGTIEADAILRLSHHRNPDKYKQVEVESPLHWLFRTHGWIRIGSAVLPLFTIVARCDVAALERLPELAPLLPAIQALAGSPRPKPKSSVELDAFWQALTDRLATCEASGDDTLADLWRDAAADGWVPGQLPGAHGKVPLNAVYVTGSADLARRARVRGWTVVELDEDTGALWRQRGALDLDATFNRGWDAALASFATLADALPEVKTVLSQGAEQQSYTQFVSGLHLAIDEEREPVPCLHWEGVLYLDQTQLEDVSHRERLRAILTEASAAGWLRCSPAEALNKIADATLEARRRLVAEGVDLAERLLLAVAGDVDALRAALGEAACRALAEDAAPAQVAALALDLLGPAVLQDGSIRAAMEAADVRPPSRWGTDEARAFVLTLGFPESFAQSQGRRLDAELLVAGPLPLRPLHPEYQEEVFVGLKGLIDSGSGRRRAVVSLPTGGGKTRVAVQAAVELVLKPAKTRRVVLWVAQTNELCEQAVQSFRQVWQNLGAEGESLRVIRFWGGHGNPAKPANAEPTVVVASIQTLNSRFEATALDWLAEPGLVVVDECHHAITPSYTSLLRWLDAEAPRPGALPKDEPPLVGLSATPFRMDDEESRRLAKRFDERQYPPDQEGLTERLIAGGFLARAEYQALETDTSVSADLLADLDSLWDSNDGARFDGVLERVNQELAANDARNARLIETLQATNARQILFFTNSVRHAEEMAARLCLLGIPAAAVSGETPATARRWFLDRFKDGSLRVLCNFNVLATGFDAPSTDLVLIARQVKSPVSYMQMVGRGLRGPRNGGTETCTILTAMDNLGRFRERHPFHYCRGLYQRA